LQDLYHKHALIKYW